MSKRKKKKQINMRFAVGIALSTLLIIFTMISDYWSTYTKLNLIDEIEIKGAVIIPANEFYESLDPLLGTSIGELDTREMCLLLESHPFVHAARISKIFPNKVVAEIRERDPVALLNMDPILYIDAEGIVLPELGSAAEKFIPIMSGFNTARELYPIGQQTVSQKVLESVNLIDFIIEFYPRLYDNLSEVTLNSNDEFVLILAHYPTKVVLGAKKIHEKIQILDAFEQTIPKQIGLHHYSKLDLRYNRQIIAQERS